MKILATFDGSTRSEVILPQLQWMAHLPDPEFTFLLIAHNPHEVAQSGHPSQLSVARLAGLPGLSSAPVTISTSLPALAEDRGEAIARTLSERSGYLQDLVARMPEGPKYSVDVRVAKDVPAAIIEYAKEHAPDVIVMGTHGESGIIHRLFGNVAEQVVRSGVAPVLLVHPVSDHPH